MRKKIFLVSFIFLLLDIISKIIVKSSLSLNESIIIIPNFLNLTYVLNNGAAFSILSGKQVFLIITSILILIMFIRHIKKEKLNNYKVLYYSLLIGGLLGNLLDRVIYRGVIDFLDFKIFNYNAPIFNLADTFICISVGLIILESILGGKNENKGYRK